MNEMHRSGFEPELLAWKAKVIAARPSVQPGTYYTFYLKNLYSYKNVTF